MGVFAQNVGVSAGRGGRHLTRVSPVATQEADDTRGQERFCTCASPFIPMRIRENALYEGLRIFQASWERFTLQKVIELP